MDTGPLILACGDPFKNVGPFGWLVIYAFIAGLVISCLLAVVNPLLAATMKVDWRRKRFHLGWVVAYVSPGIVFAVALAAGWEIGGVALMWLWLVYFCSLPVWTILHFGVLLWKRRQLRRSAPVSTPQSVAASSLE